jgi:RNA polymerase sigma-70 factor (ECF subfamily)
MAGTDDLVKRARHGERQALESLLEQHLPMVYRFVGMRLGREHPDLDDVVQETLVAAASSIGTLRAEREGSVPVWFLTIARHKVADHFRKPAVAPVDLEAVALSEDPEHIAGERDRERRLREAMRNLTPDQEEVLMLRYVLGFDGVQVAAITGRTVGAIKALQHRGLASLGRLMRENAEEWR